jgi:hypothetical protein
MDRLNLEDMAKAPNLLETQKQLIATLLTLDLCLDKAKFISSLVKVSALNYSLCSFLFSCLQRITAS